MDAVLSHEMRQYVIDHENTIISKETHERSVNEFDFDHYQVFGLDIMMSSGKGKAIERGEKCTIYKRNIEIEYPLRMKTSRELLTMVNKQYPTFPFSMRNFENNRCRLGINECVRYNLMQPYPILAEKNGCYVAQFKYTVIIHPKGTLQITGLPLDMSCVHPEFQIEDNELRNLLSVGFNGSLPAFYHSLKVPNFSDPVFLTPMSMTDVNVNHNVSQKKGNYSQQKNRKGNNQKGRKVKGKQKKNYQKNRNKGKKKYNSGKKKNQRKNENKVGNGSSNVKAKMDLD